MKIRAKDGAKIDLDGLRRDVREECGSITAPLEAVFDALEAALSVKPHALLPDPTRVDAAFERGQLVMRNSVHEAAGAIEESA